MSFYQRIKMIFSSKASQIVARAENPAEMLDYSYQRQLDLLSKVRKGQAEVATARKQIENQMRDVDSKMKALESQAEKAIGLNRDDLAREALTRKAEMNVQMNDLSAQHEALLAQEQKITASSKNLQVRVEAFRTKKEVMKATATAAEASARIGEAFAGIGNEVGNIGMAIDAAENKTLELQARAEAMQELADVGAFDNSTDYIDRELNSISVEQVVTAELESLKMKELT